MSAKQFTDYSTPFGEFALARYPEQDDPSLQAWDSADQYLLRYLYEEVSLEGKNILIVNDLFGGLLIPLLADRCSSNTATAALDKIDAVSDSTISRLAFEKNSKRNGLDCSLYRFTDESENYREGVDLVLLKLPKSLAQLQQQLVKIRQVVKPGARVIAADKTKRIHTSNLRSFESVFGNCTTSLAWKKSRLIFSSVDKSDSRKSVGQLGAAAAGDSLDAASQVRADYETKLEPRLDLIQTYDLPNWQLRLRSTPGVFSAGKLDQGTGFLLDNIADVLLKNVNKAHPTIIDLGCGNGVIGLVAKRILSDAHVSFVDESYSAVADARCNYLSHFGDRTYGASITANFLVGDGLSELVDSMQDGQLYDAVLCNPPFHQQQSMGVRTAQAMIRQSFQILGRGGLLCVVANRHLAYGKVIKRHFGNCELVCGNSKFVILIGVKECDG